MGEPTAEEVAEVLRSARYVMDRASVGLIACVSADRVHLVEGDFNRLRTAVASVDALLDRLPPEPPMTPEQEAKVGAVIGAVLRKRFGDGTAEEVAAAIDAAWHRPDTREGG